MNALEVEHLSKRFGKLKAVNDISFNIPEGAVFGLLGRNGAGKTTTIRMMMNIYSADSGTIHFRGNKVNQEFRDTVGYLPEERGLYKKMRVLDTLLFFAELKGKKDKAITKQALEYLEQFDLLDRKLSKIEDLSKGNQQKIQFIATILHDPEFLILDEPFSGLDPINTNILKDIILDLKKKGKVIIFSTHLMDFAEKMCDHIAIMDRGEIKVNGSLSDVKKEYSKQNISLVYEGNIDFLKKLEFVKQVEDFGNHTGIKVRDENDIQLVLKQLVEHNILVKKFDANDISVHEIFLSVSGHSEIKEGAENAE
jgi:ABC-2 type transport system ATP-binding protein